MNSGKDRAAEREQWGMHKGPAVCRGPGPVMMMMMYLQLPEP